MTPAPRRVTRLARIAAAVLVCATGAAAHAQDRFASPRYGAFEMSLSGYRPKVDAEFAATPGPFATAFGNGRNFMVRADLAYSLIVNYGSLDVGVGAGLWQTTGHGLNQDGSVATDLTRLRIIPSRISLTYRLDQFVERYPIPLVPFVRLSLDRYWWWVYNGSGNTANANGKGGSGATNGYSFSGGVAFLLDFVDRSLAREMDRDTGINHTYLFVEFSKSVVDDFGSSKSWNLSDVQTTISGGLLFVF